MVKKRCAERGCTIAPRCDSTKHPWWIFLNLRRGKSGDKPEKGPVTKYAALLPKGAQIPRNKSEAEDLERLVRQWVLDGRPPMDAWAAAFHPAAKPAPTPTIDDGDHPVILAAAAQQYGIDYITPELADDSATSIVNMICAWRPPSGVALGQQSISVLCDEKVARAYLRAVKARTSESTSDHHFTRWSHFRNWCVHEYHLDGANPFYHRTLRPKGIRKYDPKSLKGARYRRLHVDEDAALEQTFRTWPDGGMMLARYHCALDTMLRRGEMLKITKDLIIREKVHGATKFVLRLTAAITKGALPRDVEVESDRLTEFLSRDRIRFAQYPFGQLDGAKFTVANFRIDWENALVASGLYAGEYRKVVGKNYANRWVWTARGGEHGELHWHDLRHEGASRLHERTVPLVFIQQLLGHKSLATTQRYLNVRPTDRREHLRRVAGDLGV